MDIVTTTSVTAILSVPDSAKLLADLKLGEDVEREAAQRKPGYWQLARDFTQSDNAHNYA